MVSIKDKKTLGNVVFVWVVWWLKIFLSKYSLCQFNSESYYRTTVSGRPSFIP